MLNFRPIRKFSFKPSSYIHGTSMNPLQYITVSAKFDQISQLYSDNVALISHHQEKEYKYGELWGEANHIAASLIALGMKPKDRIGIYAPNCAEWYLIQLAASLADLILVNINPAYQSYELKYVLNKVGCKSLVTAASLKKSNYIDILYGLAPELRESKAGQLNSKELPFLKNVIRLDDEKSEGFFNFEDLYSYYEHNHEKELQRRRLKQEPDHPANIQFTSGFYLFGGLQK
jgi:fatty-acyl-CoA synthase